MIRSESIRLHQDWWAECRTCRFWSATDEQRLKQEPSICSNPESPLHQQETWSGGHCKGWDSFDLDVAVEVMAAYEEKREPV